MQKRADSVLELPFDICYAQGADTVRMHSLERLLQRELAKDVQRLARALELATLQRNTAYACSWDKSLNEMIADDDKEIEAALAGSEEV